MPELHEFTDPDLFTAGTLGPPGQRVFYLQARQNGHVLSLRCEKQQVSALADYLEGLLSDLPGELPPNSSPGNLSLVTATLEEWVVGAIGVEYDHRSDRFVIEAEELIVVTEEVSEAEAEALLAGARKARFSFSREQVAWFVPHGQALVSSGRPPCFLCGRPMDPDGHMCPRNN